MNIRQLENNDITEVVDLWYNTSVKAHTFLSKHYWKENKTKMANIYLPNSETYLAINNDKIIGFISMINNYLAAIFVKFDMQEQGIGSKLLSYVKERKDSIHLKVYKKNSNSIQFYTRRDFNIVSEEKDINTGEIEILMEWNK